METALKGLEVELPGGTGFHDKDGNPRTAMRVAWWNTGATTYDEVWFSGSGGAPAEIVGHPLPADLELVYPKDAPIVLFGHYWLRPDGRPRVQRPNVVCLDYSVARGGWLTAARLGDGLTFCWV